MAIEIRDLTVEFRIGRKTISALQKLNLSVAQGEVYGFIGPNGAGKTTTIKMVVGLLQPTSGTVKVAGYDVQTQPLLAKASSGYVPDTPNLYAKLTGRELLRFVGDLYDLDRKQVAQRTDELLRMFDLTAAADDTVDSYSHGMQQKASLASALMHDPKVLVLDEPTNDPDVNTLRALEEALEEFAGTAVVVSHDRWFLDRICTHLIVFEGESIAKMYIGN